MNSPVEPKMSGSFELLKATEIAPNALKKEPGHPCSGEGRCCGGCRNPKRPVAALAPNSETSPPIEPQSGKQVDSNH
jgi:hypothetical protein